ncbi:MAG: hypothetical protein R2761_21610 [Acidimicrobiales bacterium]
MLAAASLVAVACAVVARPHVDVAVRLSEHRHVPATTVLAGLGLMALGLAGVGLRFRRLALVGLAVVSMALAAAWLGLTPHRFSGPVVANLSMRHGLHVTDALAVAPTVFALSALAQAVRSGRPTLATAAPRREQPIRR